MSIDAYFDGKKVTERWVRICFKEFLSGKYKIHVKTKL